MSTDSKTVRAMIYGRISEDASGQGLGVGRQLDDARELAAARGWEVVGEFTDNDISAYSGAHRPGYQALMTAVDAREVDRIVVYMTSRLWRSRKERAGAIDRLADARVSVAAVRGPDLDLTTASGRMVAGILGEFDTAESAIKSERVARASDQRAAEGRPSGDLGFGWQKVGDEYVLDQVEADVVREIVTRIIEGATLQKITADLTARGIPAPGSTHRRRYRRPDNQDGVKWGTSGVRKLAVRPSNAGLRQHRGEIVGHGTWPAIITEDRHAQVVAVLADPSRMTNGGNAVRRHLLSFGIGECGVCGSRLRVAKRSGNLLYCCDTTQGCTGRRQEWVDKLVTGVVVERLKRSDVADLLTPRPSSDSSKTTKALVELEDVRSRLDAAADAFATGDIDTEQMKRISAALRPRIEQAEKESRILPSVPPPAALKQMAGHRDAQKVWDGLDILTQRAVMQTLGIRVRILKTRRGPGFNPESVEILWKAGQ